MRHDRTIQGLPWSPCAACPRRAENGGAGDEGVCPSRRHAAHCRNAEQSPGLWGPIIRAEPPEDRPAREGPPPRATELTEAELAAIAERQEAEWAIHAEIADELRASMTKPPCDGCDEEEEEDEPPLPSVATMVRSLVKTGAAVARHLMKTGAILAPDSLRDARLRVCEGGEGLSEDQVRHGHCDRYKPSSGRCGSMQGCGCYVAQKAALMASECPLDRWPTEEPV